MQPDSRVTVQVTQQLGAWSDLYLVSRFRYQARYSAATWLDSLIKLTPQFTCRHLCSFRRLESFT